MGRRTEMKLYHVQFDGASFFIEAEDYIEAENYADADSIWRAHVRVLCENDYDGTEEPESVHLIHAEPVIRGALK